MRKITIKQLTAIHGKCSDAECPICQWWTPPGGPGRGSILWNACRVTEWLEDRVTVAPHGRNLDSPWWVIDDSDKEQIAALTGDLCQRKKNLRAANAYLKLLSKANQT